MVLAISLLVLGTAAFALEPPAPPSAPAPAPAPGGVTLPSRPLPPGTALPSAAAKPAAGAASTNASGARIQFDSTSYDFGKVMALEQVKHTFYFTNTGCGDLVVNDVRGQCYCTVVGEWARQLKPGEWGRIPVVLNTPNYSYPVTKVVTVTCNDLTEPGGIYLLKLKGVIWKPVDVTPATAALYLRPDVPYSSVSVRITNSLEQPLVLSPPQVNTNVFGAELKTNIFGRSYQVIISNTAALPAGSVFGRVSLKTSLTNMPVIDITTWANMQAPVAVFPGRIDLRQTPLPTNQTVMVTIINNSTNPVALSEPSVGVTSLAAKVANPQGGSEAADAAKVKLANVDVNISEVKTGHYFTVFLKFPAGFELPPGQSGQFTIKTTQPQAPLVKVPIYQAARSIRAPVALRRPAPPLHGPAAAVPQPLRPAPRPAAPLALAPSAAASAPSTNRPPPPPAPNFP